MPADPAQLRDRLAEVIRPRRRLITAYSGGVDSTVVAAVARHALGREQAVVAIGDSASLPRRELTEARDIAEQLDLQLIEIQPGEQDDQRYRANAGDRCYFCKTHLYASLHDLAQQMGIDYIANGVNRDDLGDHRPGIRAADEAAVISPLVEAGFGKTEVRAVAEHLHLPNADKPAAACLASRIAYGTEVTGERLTAVEQAEDFLRELGFTGFRVRLHEQDNVKLARIEIPTDQLPRLAEPHTRDRVVARLNQLGFTYITLDLAGFRSGSGNLALRVKANTSTPT